MASGPFTGLRVLDFTHAMAGPLCTMLLADLGAHITKVEHPGRGDGTRHMGRALTDAGDTDYFLSLNRGKESLALDLKDASDREVAMRLTSLSDVVIHNFRPGVMERLGLSYEDVVATNPCVVYAAISGFGERGPLKDRGANDITMQAMGGLMATTGELDGAPLRLGVSVVDTTAGLLTFGAIVTALYHRSKTGEGQRVHVSMLGAATTLLANYIPGVLTGGEEVTPNGREHKQLVPYQAFEARDGRFVVVGAFTQGFWRRFADVIGRPDLVEVDEFKTNELRVRHRAQLVPILEREMRRKTSAEWLGALDSANVPCAPVLSVTEALRQEQVAAIDGVVRLCDGARESWVVGLPIDLSRTPGRVEGFPPLLGADTERIKAWLGERGA